MPRQSVSITEEMEKWIDSKAEERDVSKSKILREAIETARVTGLLRSENVDPDDVESILDRIDTLEKRVQALEQNSEFEINGSNNNPDQTDTSLNDIIFEFNSQLNNQPPNTAHGKEAAKKVFESLFSDGPSTSSELKELLYPDIGDNYNSKESMWNALRNNLISLDGIEKNGREWNANPDAVDTDSANIRDWES